MPPPDCPLPAFAAHPLYASIAPWLAPLATGQVPDLAWLNATLVEAAPGTVSGAGRPIRFVDATGGADYEAGIYATGAVPTRSRDWHDFFNALAWCVWPASKAACNTLHQAEIDTRQRAGLSGRGPCRDALTQFDECGVVVVSADPELPDLLAAHAWAEAFVVRRAALAATTRFFIFGHGSWDQLRRPFVGVCAKAIYRRVDADWLQRSRPAQQAAVDRWLAVWWRAHGPALAPADLATLPLLGIPGVTPANEDPDYYADPRQFRPLPVGRPPVVVWR